MGDSAQAINNEHTLGVRKFLIVIVSSPLERWNCIRNSAALRSVNTLSYCAILESGLKDLGLSREEHTSSRKLVRMLLLYRYEILSDVPVHKAWLGSLVKWAGGLRRERSTVLPCQEWSVRHRQARSCRALQRRAKPREPPEIPALLSTWNSGPYLPMDATRTPKVYQALFVPVLSFSRGRARLACQL